MGMYDMDADACDADVLLEEIPVFITKKVVADSTL